MSDPKSITFTLNGQERTFDVDPDEKLLDLLRRADCKSVKMGCREAACGACTVILDGQTVYSCILYAWQAHGREVITVEGIGDYGRPDPIQRALVDAGAVQCGYCIPGMIMSAKAMFDENPEPDDDEMRERMDGNLCRCTGYEKIWVALHNVIEQNRSQG